MDTTIWFRQGFDAAYNYPIPHCPYHKHYDSLQHKEWYLGLAKGVKQLGFKM